MLVAVKQLSVSYVSFLKRLFNRILQLWDSFNYNWSRDKSASKVCKKAIKHEFEGLLSVILDQAHSENYGTALIVDSTKHY
jgi:hypothetical protein